MKRILITGAAGFIGANLTRRLLRDGHRIHALVRKDSDLWRLTDVLSDVSIHEAELCDQVKLGSVVKDIRPEWIFHLAAHGNYSWQDNVDRMVQTNVIGTVNLAQACLKNDFESFVNTGSSSEYGIKDHPSREDEHLDPNSCYAVTKAAATLFCRQLATSHRVNISTLRIYSAYGPYEDPLRFVPALIMAGLEGKLPPLVNPNISRDFIYIDDVLEACLSAASVKSAEPGVIYNVSTGSCTSIEKAVETARELLNIQAKPQWESMANRHWDTNVWVGDNTKIKSVLGWKPGYAFREGLKKTIEWFLANSRILERYKKPQ